MTAEDYLQEALTHQAAWMADQRRKDSFAVEDAAVGGGTIKPPSIPDATTEQDIQQARESARAWCEARNANLRPVRPIDPDDPFAVEGQKSALDFVQRRRLSKIR